MFLVTTSDQRFWKKDEKIFFLGEWCRTFDQEQVWSKLDHQVLSHHWEDRDRYYQDFLYLDDVYERYLERLSEIMNVFHGVEHSTRYWRLVIGPWLYYFIQTLYDKYLSIRTAIDSGKIKKTWIPSLEPGEYIPQDFATFQEWQSGDSYNQYFYGVIIKALGGISYETKNKASQLDQTDLRFRLRPANWTGPQGHFGIGLACKTIIKKCLESYARIIPKNWNKVVFVSSYLKHWDLFWLQLSLGQLPSPVYPWPITSKVLPNIGLRQKIKLPLGQNEFESLLQEMIPLQIPTVYVEEYVGMSQRARAEFPRWPKVIFTCNAHFSNEGFKFWVANQVERGVKLVGMQHGGHYGSALWSSNETHEIRVADKYYTWGWEDENQPKMVPVASGKLDGTKEKIKVDCHGGILWIGMSRPRYASWMLSAPVGPQMLEYINDQKSFWEALFPEAKDLLTLRLFPADFGWGIKEGLRERLPGLRFDNQKKTMYQQLCKSRLCIGTYNSTTNLETLSANFPTIAFWNFDHWKLRESARPYFDDMVRSGIFHTSPASAAVKVNEIYKDPLSWWNSSSIQEARDRFCMRFARTSETWRLEWKSDLQRLINE
jgi:putative transferase (TIGR04331 family)